MYKGIVLLKRPEGTSVEAFKAWWLGSHLDYSRQRPEVLKYTGSFTAGPAAGCPYIDDEPAFDMLVEFWCKDLETAQNVFIDPALMYLKYGDAPSCWDDGIHGHEIAVARSAA